MQVLSIREVGTGFVYDWPTDQETYQHFIDYLVRADDKDHLARIAFGTRKTYEQDRARVVVFIDGQPQVEFFGADDYGISGEVLAEIKVPGEKGERMCKYPDEPVPGRYVMFNTVGLPTRVSGKWLHKAWGVVANISDHKTMIALAALRKRERER